MGLVAHPVFKTGRAEQPSAWKVRFLRRSAGGKWAVMGSFEGFVVRRRAAKRERMKADYLIEPTNSRERRKQRRAERWLVYDTLGLKASSLEDTRELADDARERWREWRAVQRGERPRRPAAPPPGAPPR